MLSYWYSFENLINFYRIFFFQFYMSVEWDILEVPAIRNVKYYTCCDEPYLGM